MVRNATRRDIDTIVKYNINGAEEQTGSDLGWQSMRDGVSYCIRSRTDYYLVKEVDKKIVGQLRVHTHWYDWYDTYFWWIEHVYVPPKHRGNGYADELIKEVCDRATRREDVGLVLLMVNPENGSARRLYEKCGFKEHSHLLMIQEA